MSGTEENNVNFPTPQVSRLDKILSYTFGVVFVAVLLAVAIWIKNPTPFEEFVFRVVLALAAAGLGAVIPGVINVNVSKFIRAGGAIALFVLVYWFNPPSITQDYPESYSIGIPEGATVTDFVEIVEDKYSTTIIVDCERASEINIENGTVSADSIDALLRRTSNLTIPNTSFEVSAEEGIGFRLSCR